MGRWGYARQQANRAATYRRLELPDGRLVEWSELASSGRPVARLGYLDGRPVDDATLAELIGRRSA